MSGNHRRGWWKFRCEMAQREHHLVMLCGGPQVVGGDTLAPLLRICFLVLPWYWEGLTQLNHLQPLLSSLTSQELSTWEQSLSYCKRPKQSGYQCTLNCSVWRTGSPALSDRKYVYSFNHFLHSIKLLVIYWSPYTSYFYDFRGNYCAFYPCTLSGGLSF